MENKEILYVLLDQYADHEAVFLTQGVNTDEKGIRDYPKYINKVVAPTNAPVASVGGFRTLPDYTFDTIPDDYTALVLIGGYSWASPTAEQVVPLVEKAIASGKIVGAICNAASFMAKHGFLNHVKHTGNGLQLLKMWGGNYTNEEGYVNEQAVSDGRIVTANGTGQNEFAKELLLLLENDTPDTIERYYQFYQQGLVKLFAPAPKYTCNTVGLLTVHQKEVVEFYTKAFGFTTDWNGKEPNVDMQLGDMHLILFPRPAFEEMTNQHYHYPDGFNGTMEIALSVPTYADVDDAFAHALKMGGKAVMVPTTEPWGQRTCYVADPDGNLVEILGNRL